MVQHVISPLLVPGHRYSMSLDDYWALPEYEGLRIEWVDGEAIVFMPALNRHAQITMFMTTLLSGFINLFDLGAIYSEQFAMDVPTRPSVRLPDILVVLKENLHRIKREGLFGPADFVVEFISEDSTTRDRRQKYLEYETAGVREYLWVEGREGRTGFEYFRLDDQGHFQPVLPHADGRYHSTVVTGFWFDPAWFAMDPLPNPLRLLALITPEGWRRFAEDIASGE